jgi:hypothetical protein
MEEELKLVKEDLEKEIGELEEINQIKQKQTQDMLIIEEKDTLKDDDDDVVNRQPSFL